MKNTIKIMFITVIGFSAVFTSCKKDKEEDPQLSQEIKNIVPDSTLTKIIALGMPVNKGSNPPSLVNIFKMSPLTLTATNIANDFAEGHVFADYKFRFYEQDNKKLTIKIDDKSGTQIGTGSGGFISGEGNDFSVFMKIHSISADSTSKADLLNIISGTITSDGIKNCYLSLFMLDDYGDPQGIYMENESGRVFNDSDGMSPIVGSLQEKSAAVFPMISVSSGFIQKKTE